MSTTDVTAGIAEQLVAESHAMVAYALASGLEVPASILEMMVADGEHRGSVSSLARAHAQLARLVAPATPRTLRLLRDQDAPKLLSFLGPVRLVRQLTGLTLVLMASFIAIPLSEHVSYDSGDIFTGHGLELLLNELFFVSAAGVGAAFAALFQVNRYINRGTYDPKYESSYWLKLILGIVAGVVLAALIPTDATFTRPLLALLGGFSASIVHRVLSRLVDTLESLVSGSPADAAQAEVTAEQARVRADAERDRLRTGTALARLHAKVAAGADTESVRGALESITRELYPDLALGDGETDAPPLDGDLDVNGSVAQETGQA